MNQIELGLDTFGDVSNDAQGNPKPMDQVIRDVLLKAQPTRRFVTVEEIGALALFLVSDAARSITGAALPVEGGWTAQ